MAGWEQARDELDQEQARRKRFEELAEDAAHTLVRVLDPRIRQFVQTLHDHNQWPMESREITEEKTTEKKKGLLRKRVPQTRLEKRTVTEPSIVEIRATDTLHSYALTISSSQRWGLYRLERDYYEPLSPTLIFSRTTKETQMVDRSKLVDEWSSGTDPELAINLNALSNALIKEMANYLIHKELPLPRD